MLGCGLDVRMMDRQRMSRTRKDNLDDDGTGNVWRDNNIENAKVVEDN